MSNEVDTAYFSRRAREERTMAEEARGQRARERHVQLADKYESLARERYFAQDAKEEEAAN